MEVKIHILKRVVDTFATRDKKGCLQSNGDSSSDDDEAPEYKKGTLSNSKANQ